MCIILRYGFVGKLFAAIKKDIRFQAKLGKIEHNSFPPYFNAPSRMQVVGALFLTGAILCKGGFISTEETRVLEDCGKNIKKIARAVIEISMKILLDTPELKDSEATVDKLGSCRIYFLALQAVLNLFFSCLASVKNLDEPLQDFQTKIRDVRNGIKHAALLGAFEEQRCRHLAN